MKKIFKIAVLTAMCMLLGVLSGCGGEDVGDFTAKTAGVWQRNGNLQDERLEVLGDGTWEKQTLEDGVWTTTAQGTIAYNKEYKTFEFSDDMSNRIYPVEFPSGNGEVLYFRDNYYRAEDSVDGFAAFDGKWCKEADRDSDYYSIENGEWKWFEPEGMGHVSVDYGYLAWNGAEGELLAFAYADGEVFATFVPSDTGELMLDDVPYVFMEDPSFDEILDEKDDFSDTGENIADEFPIMIGEFYYLDGEIGQPSLYFFSDGQVDYDDGYGGATIEAVYCIVGDEIEIKTSDGTMLGVLQIVDYSILLDDGGEDIYAIATD